MNLRKISLLLIQSCILLFVCTASFEQVHAAEKRNSPLRIVISVNGPYQMTMVKEALINSLIDYNIYPELQGNINFEASELKTASLDLTKIGKQKTAVSLKIKTINPLSENSLFKNTISTTVEFDVRDMNAPELVSEKDCLKRSIHAELDPYQHITVTDNYDQDVQLSYETDYDSQTPGEYTITYIAKDASGNTSTMILPIVVASQKYSNFGTDQHLIFEMLNLINDYRASYGLSPYTLGSANALAAAGVRAAEARVFLSHDRPDGRHYKTAFNEYGVEYSSPYEILSFAGTTPADNLAWWKQSGPHNARLLSRTSTSIAIGYCDGMWAAIVYNE